MLLLSCHRKDVDLNITYVDYIDIPLEHPLLPSRGTIYRNQDPSQIPYEISPESLVDEFYPTVNVSLDDPFIFREVRGTTVRVFPFQYNAVTQTLRFYSKIKLELVENNNEPTNPFLRERVSFIKEVENIYSEIFLNYNAAKVSANLTSGDYGDILVITTSDYSTTMDIYIQWKKEMGYNVTKTIVNKGSNVANTISSAYSSNPNLMYVQLAGDWADLKSPTINVTTSTDPCDPFMGAVSGSDNYIDIAVGRFSCSNTTNLLTQINKAINYEKNPNTTSNWRETFIGIASNEGPGDDNEVDYTHIQRVYTQRLQPFTYNSHKQNYDPGASASTLAGHINAGASTIAYCGHGSETSFVTTGFSNSNINSLTNGDKLPFIVSVACVNGTFHYSSDCFAETWLRKSGGGAVVTLMSTINQPWTPPQRGQDYFYDILSGGFNYDNDGISQTVGINTSEQRTHWGAIVVNSFVLMLKESNTSSDLETIKTWTTFGDASLQLRTKAPDNLTLSNTNPEVGVPFTGIAKINGNPAKNVMICISAGGNYYSGLTNTSGQYSINHNLSEGQALLVATAFNSTTIYENIQVIDSDPCLPITNLSASLSTGSVTLSWSAPAEGSASGYRIYRDGILLASVTNLSYTQTNVATGYYEYCVAAVYGGNECYAKECVNVFINDETNSVCESPTNLTVIEQSSSLHSLSWNAPSGNNVIFDDIEAHDAFTINSSGFVPWTFIDGDNVTTYSIANYTFQNQGSKMASIVFDPNLVLHSTNNTPLTQTTDGSPFEAYSGSQFFACFNATNSTQTNDWIISPELNFNENFQFKFFARSGHKTAYAESFRVLYSTTTNTQAAFTNVLESVSSAPFSWTEYSYSVPANAKFVAINCNSNDKYYFCVDDIYIGDGSAPSSPLVAYNVYCDGNLIGTTSNTNFDNSEASPGSHEYCVEAVYSNNCVSPQVCQTIGQVVNTFTITATAGQGGSISPSATVTVNEASNKTFSIIPNACYEINDVLVDGVSVGAVSTYTFNNINSNHTIFASFNLINYSVNLTVSGEGDVSGISPTVVCGSSSTLNFSADECWQLSSVLINGVNQNIANNSLVLNNISNNLDIIVEFTEIYYSISTNIGIGGSITGLPETVLCGSNVNFELNVDECYNLASISVNGNPISLNGNFYSITNVYANMIINVTFVPIEYSVSVFSGTGGSINVSPTVNCGEDLSVSLSSDECYELNELKINGETQTVLENPFIYQNVQSNLEISANFTQKNIIISASAGEGGSIYPVGEVELACGANQIFVISPDEAYYIYAVYVDGINYGIPESYLFSNVTENSSIEAEFALLSGLLDDNFGNNFNLYPNPCNDKFSLVVAETDINSICEIYSLDGKILRSIKIENLITEFDISSFSKGSYYVKLLGNDSINVLKLIKF